MENALCGLLSLAEEYLRKQLVNALNFSDTLIPECIPGSFCTKEESPIYALGSVTSELDPVQTLLHASTSV